MNLNEFLDQKIFGSYINGEFDVAPEKANQSFVSPVTNQEWKQIVPAGKEDSQRAIAAASKAFHFWKWSSSTDRSLLLRQFGAALMQNQTILAKTMAMEMGKPISEGLKEVAYAAGFFNWFAGEAERIYGQTIPSQSVEKRIMLIKEPIGVAALISPWNFPLAMPAKKVAAALAAGCTVILKPSPECPFSSSVFAYIFNMFGLPPGVFNLLIGPEKEIGEELLNSQDVRKISFTGSCETGKFLYQKSAQTLKKLTLELGGHAPVLIFDDANLEKAVKGTIAAKFRNNGQTCISANRIYVQEGIYREFIDHFVEAAKKLVVGEPLHPDTEISRVLHPESTKKVKAHILDAVRKGAKLELKGKMIYEPTILSDVTPNMLIYQEETFGPVAGITPFKTMHEAVQLANSSPYGLASYLFTENLTTGHYVVGALEYGIVGLNDGLVSSPQGPFGGIKNSGFGREGGPSGINEYLYEKCVSIVM